MGKSGNNWESAAGGVSAAIVHDQLFKDLLSVAAEVLRLLHRRAGTEPHPLQLSKLGVDLRTLSAVPQASE